MWTLSGQGDSEAVSQSSDKTEGQVDFPPALATARVAVPTVGPSQLQPFSPIWDDNDGTGQDDADPTYDDPARQGLPSEGLDGVTMISFDAVAPPHNGPMSRAHTGTGGSGHGGYALGAGRPD